MTAGAAIKIRLVQGVWCGGYPTAGRLKSKTCKPESRIAGHGGWKRVAEPRLDDWLCSVVANTLRDAVCALGGRRKDGGQRG